VKTITIGFSKSKKFFPIGSWLIRAYMRTPYSHVYLKFHSESLDRTLIYEAVGNGVRFVGLKVWETHAVEVDSFDISINTDSYIKLLQYCVDNSGVEYGFMQNLGVVLSNLLGKKNNIFTSGLNCSEIVAAELEMNGFVFNKENNLILPKDIYKVISEAKIY